MLQSPELRDLKVKDLQALLELLSPKGASSTLLTPTQIIYCREGMDQPIWAILNSRKLPLIMRDTLWKFATKTLPLFHKEKEVCPYTESSSHIFFLHPVIKAIGDYLLFKIGSNLCWERPAILKKFSTPAIDPEMVVCLSVFHAAWLLRNTVKHEGLMSIPDLVLTISRATKWCMHLLAVDWETIRLSMDISCLTKKFLSYNPIELV